MSLLILTAQTSVQPSHLVLEHVDGCHGMAIPWQDGLCDLDLIKSEDWCGTWGVWESSQKYAFNYVSETLTRQKKGAFIGSLKGSKKKPREAVKIHQIWAGLLDLDKH